MELEEPLVIENNNQQSQNILKQNNQQNLNKPEQQIDPNYKLQNITQEKYKQYKLQQKYKNLNFQTVNRRYTKLQQLIEKDEFFSEEEIKIREPILYFLYCGQYKRGNIKANTSNQNTFQFCEYLMERAIDQDYKEKLIKEYEVLKDKINYPKLDSEEEITEEDLEDNQDELIRLLHDKFISGQESKHFDYNQIDNDETLDDNKQIECDKEEQYYDDDQIIQNNTDTGIQDF